MFFREAKLNDIDSMHQVRLAVLENKLSNPDRVTKTDYERYITIDGKGWVCEVDGDIWGFAIVDLKNAHVWGLFVRPEREGKFIGRMLHDMLVTWCFVRDVPKLSLTTAPNTRAERFYTTAGWTRIGEEPSGEIRFELENNLEPRDYLH